MPTTMKSYILEIQRGFHQQWGCNLKLLSGKFLSCPNSGLTSVLDSKARRLQEKCNHTQHHNVLFKDELLLLFNSQSLSPESPKGFQDWVVFTVEILTAMRPTAMALMKRIQFKKMSLGAYEVWKFTGTVGSIDGGSKKSCGGWKVIGKTPVEVCVWNGSYGDDSINVFLNSR